MAKFDFKQFLLAKGEKVALGVGLAGLGLFGVLGVMNAVSAESPSKVSSTRWRWSSASTREVMSRTAASTNSSSPNRRGLRLISVWNSVPSRRLARSESSAPIDRTLGLAR